MADLKPCPFCGKSHTLKLTTAEDMANEGEDDPLPWEHSAAWAVVCDASSPKGPEGCGATGGFMPTEAEAVAVWNTRAPGVLEPRKPDGYAYAYDSPFGGIRFNNGEPVNGSKPTRAIPYWLGAPPNGVKTGGGTDGR